ncbi:RHOMBOID-like protein 2 [Phoenix dactylifera]|uniref:RHOMBOID-like protein n=1 Tax=Phoenix dactylifera TaxID=42345 RepID=A0A8B7BUE6_PHODC|nr:RHOMBOID-like protein 2 [Phoenix dactylifera]
MVPQGEGNSTIHPLEANTIAPPPPREQPELRPFRRWAPWLVSVFVVANVVMFLVTMYVNNCPKNSPRPCVASFLGWFAFNSLRENPLFGPSSSTLEKMGALVVTKVVKEHQGWRLITCIWLHAGVIHLLANMLCLLLIGVRLEQEFGFVRIGSLYVMSGFGGSVLSALFIQSRISVGASGALFGLLGGMLSELITNWTIYTNKFTALLTLIFIIAINLAVGLLPFVDNFAHIGGFISGFLLGFVFLIRPQFGWISQKNVPPGYHTGSLKRKHKIYQYILWIIAAIFLIVGFIVGLIMLFRGVNANDHCSWCHYLSCVPTSKWSCKSSAICFSAQDENGLNLTCQSYGRNLTYFFPSSSETRINELCDQLCS